MLISQIKSKMSEGISVISIEKLIKTAIEPQETPYDTVILYNEPFINLIKDLQLIILSYLDYTTDKYLLDIFDVADEFNNYENALKIWKKLNNIPVTIQLVGNIIYPNSDNDWNYIDSDYVHY